MNIKQMLLACNKRPNGVPLVWRQSYVGSVILTPGDAFFTSVSTNLVSYNDVYSDPFPDVGNWFVDVLVDFAATPGSAIMLGVTTTTINEAWTTGVDFAAVYNNGGFYGRAGSGGIPLVSGTYRMNLDRTAQSLNIRWPGGNIGSVPYPLGTPLRLYAGNDIPMGFPNVTIVGGRAYPGNGGLT